MIKTYLPTHQRQEDCFISEKRNNRCINDTFASRSRRRTRVNRNNEYDIPDEIKRDSSIDVDFNFLYGVTFIIGKPGTPSRVLSLRNDFYNATRFVQ